jgi:hypothetical protein
VSVQLAGSRYALRTPEMCNNMPPAYTKEITCNGELMPQVINVCACPHTALCLQWGGAWLGVCAPEGAESSRAESSAWWRSEPRVIADFGVECRT